MVIVRVGTPAKPGAFIFFFTSTDACTFVTQALSKLSLSEQRLFFGNASCLSLKINTECPKIK